MWGRRPVCGGTQGPAFFSGWFKARRGRRPAGPGPARLPKFALLSSGAHHGVAAFAAEGGGEFWHIRKRRICAVFGNGMRIGIQAQAQFLGAILRGPHASKREEEALVAGIAV